MGNKDGLIGSEKVLYLIPDDSEVNNVYSQYIKECYPGFDKDLRQLKKYLSSSELKFTECFLEIFPKTSNYQHIGISGKIEDRYFYVTFGESIGFSGNVYSPMSGSLTADIHTSVYDLEAFSLFSKLSDWCRTVYGKQYSEQFGSEYRKRNSK